MKLVGGEDSVKDNKPELLSENLDLKVDEAIVVRNKEARTDRLNKQEKAFQISESERKRLQPANAKRTKRKTIVFVDDDGDEFYRIG
jgi:CRISPR/Cas system-associated protein Csm6